MALEEGSIKKKKKKLTNVSLCACVLAENGEVLVSLAVQPTAQ